jgi:hypothetical protein
MEDTEVTGKSARPTRTEDTEVTGRSAQGFQGVSDFAI